MKKTIFSFFLALSGMCAISAAHADTALFDLPDLSQAAKDSLVAHYDGRTGVETDDNVVKSWTPVDGSGKPLAPMIVNTSGTDQKGITYDSSTATLKFDDRNGGTRSLVGTLGNTAGSAFTVFWKGCYDPSAPYASSGTYVYNIGPNKIAHKRDGSDGGWRVELYNGRAYGGDDITAYDDVPATVWSTVITAKSHKGYANGTNLNVTGSPSYAVPANAAIRIGAYSGKGYDLQGDISQLIIFQSALSDEDRQIVEDYLKQIAVGDPSVSSDKSGYFGSEEIQVVFLHGPGNAGDKIAVLPAGAVPGQSAPLFETPTSGTSGKVTFSSTKLPQGNYSLWYLSANNGVIAGPTGIAIDPVTTLTVDKTQYNPGEPITATFASGPGNARDYIGIYPSHIMPTRASGRLTWQYANGTSSAGGNVTAGNVTIPTNYVVPAGEYRAWFFPNYGYVSTASSAPFTITAVPPGWQTEPIRLRHVVTGNSYNGFLAPYLSQQNSDGPHTFEKTGGPAWLAVAGDGALSGTPDTTDAGKNTFTVRAASATTGLSSEVSFEIPVFLPGQENVPRLSVMSYNTWHGAGLRKGIEAIACSGADIIGLQESWNPHSRNLANALGWYRADSGDNNTAQVGKWRIGSAQLISRYPIIEELYAGVAIGARIRVCENPPRDVIVYSCHLDSGSYAPYLGSGYTAEQYLQHDAKSKRCAEIQGILADMSAQLANADNIPVFLTGDFNCPSHLDWTEATSPLHHGMGPVAWPTSKAVENAGLLDSYRVAHPDPVASPGETWSPIYNPPYDRIDFVYHKGSGLRVLSSDVIPGPVRGGLPGVRYRHIWPSDHAAVVSAFSLDLNMPHN